MNTYMVCTRCMTYNHAPFIKSALEGFAMQQTDFPMIFAVVDDSSTDGEADVIRQWAEEHLALDEKGYAFRKTMPYGEQIFARHRENANASFVIVLLSENHTQAGRGGLKLNYISDCCGVYKYLALCEGDDYWIDPKKLQKQVDFLESHPDHTLCIHAYRRDEYKGDEVVSREVYKYSSDVEIIPDEDVLNGTGMFGATASMVYRASAVKDYPDWTKRAPVGDRPLKFVLFARGHIAYINEVMSVYRVGVPGSWTVRVNRNRKENRKTRQRFVRLLVDFDNWTGKKYHSLVAKAIRDYKKACRKNDIRYLILKPYRQLKRLFK